MGICINVSTVLDFIVINSSRKKFHEGMFGDCFSLSLAWDKGSLISRRESNHRLAAIVATGQ